MTVEFCDWCSAFIDERTGATVKVYDRSETDKHEKMWGNNYSICDSCLEEITNKVEEMIK